MNARRLVEHYQYDHPCTWFDFTKIVLQINKMTMNVRFCSSYDMGFYRLQVERYFMADTDVVNELHVSAKKCYYTCGQTTFVTE